MLSYILEAIGAADHQIATTLKATTASTQSVEPLQDSYVEEYSAFAEFIGKYGRSYASKDEHMTKFEVFKANYRDVQSHNARYAAGAVTWTKAVNQFTDFTEEEFNQRYLSAKLNKPKRVAQESQQAEQSGRPHMLGSSRLPETVDWYKAGKVSESVDQGGCGSCWAFTTATTLESLNAIQNKLKEVPTYSVQYLLDCDDVNWGCEGGWMADAYLFTAERGIIDWDAYPRGYQGRKNRCADPNSAGVKRFHNTESHEEDYISNYRMKELIAQNPVGVAIYSNFGCLGSYSGGIVFDRDCDCSSDPDNKEVNHAVTVIGYGKSDVKGCSEYWLIKNSWGAYWGEQGHFRLCADRAGATAEYGTCQINSYVQWPSL